MAKRRRPNDEESSEPSGTSSSPPTSVSQPVPLTRAEKKTAKKKAERAKKKTKKRQPSPGPAPSAVPSATAATGPSQPASVNDTLAGPGRFKTAAHDVWHFFKKGSIKEKTQTICKVCE
jgi:hypothetical protein